eukprot:m.284445 g.284445  ORF g.284445 m.284445 type:complete len:258 (-) comp11142_c0_seq1:49-822(-)
MAIGKNKRLTKGKRGQKKKVVDVMSKKDWYDVKAPAYFEQRQVCKTLVTRTQGTKIASDGLKNRVFEVSLADLNKSAESYRKIRMMVEDIQGKNCLLNFHGIDFTTDKLRSLVRKWQSLIEATVDCKTTDGYVLRLFAIGFTKKRSNQISKTSYALSSQKRAIRAKMTEIIAREVAGSDLKEVISKLVSESMEKEIEKATQGIYPLHDIYIRKVKTLKKPKFDISRLREVHGDVGTVTSSGKIKGGEFKEPAVQASV